MADIGQWYNSLPRLTRYWLTATVVMSLLCRFGILPIEYMFLSREHVLGKCQLWRCVTSLFVFPLEGSTAFPYLLNCYFITQYSARMEKEQYGRSPADYLYLLSIAAVLANLGGLIFNVYFLMDMLEVAITYIWCQLNKEVIVNFWFGSRFKAMYLPWVLAGFELIFHGSLASLVGIMNGHIYYFLKFQYPQQLGGYAILQTPAILKQYMPDTGATGAMDGVGIPPPESRAQAQRLAPRNRNILANIWGHGNTLGRN